jgi:hypothetical protein
MFKKRENVLEIEEGNLLSPKFDNDGLIPVITVCSKTKDVLMHGASCHVGYRSCFYRSIPMGPIDNGREIEMEFLEKEKKFDPEEVYKGQPNPTKI